MNPSIRRSLFVLPTCLALPLLAGCGGGGGGGGGSGGGANRFEILVENIAGPQALVTSAGTAPVVFSPFLFTVDGGTRPIFQAGAVAPANGLEAFAEDGDPSDLITALQRSSDVDLIGIASTPVGSDAGSVLLPGASYRLVLPASPGDNVTFAASFLQGNDLLVATPDSGIPLFDAGGAPISADVTAQLALLDAGTEVNEEPGAGPNQPFRQAAENQGTSESKPVGPVNDGFSYPAVASVLRVTIRPVSAS